MWAAAAVSNVKRVRVCMGLFSLTSSGGFLGVVVVLLGIPLRYCLVGSGKVPLKGSVTATSVVSTRVVYWFAVMN